MATLITVHGTSDTGPEDGDKWWQRGGPFEEDIQRWVTSDDGAVRLVPHLWHGRNSEAGRYGAASELAQRVKALEEAGEPYCLVGHSHGGSVIAHLLAQAQDRKSALAHMRRWITVGTPFISTKRRSLLFSRLRTPGVAALMILLYLALMWIAFAVSSAQLVFFTREGLKNPALDILLLILAPLFVVALYILLWRSQPRKLKTIRPRSNSGQAEKFAARWTGLWHRDDEIINGGRMLKDLKFRPFRPDFASPLFAFSSLLLIPVILWFAASAELYKVLSGYLEIWDKNYNPADNPDFFKAFARDSFAIVCLPAMGIFEVLRAAEIEPSDSVDTNRAVLGSVLVAGAAIGFLVIWLLAMGLHRIVLTSSRAISSVLSGVLNDLTRTQIVALGYGSDSKGEFAVGASPHPAWITPGYPSLPPALEEEIAQSSDEAAAKALSRLRQTLSTLDLGEGGGAGDVLTRHVTWAELVHTNYFRVRRFRKLVAFIIAQQEGFSPTEEFLRDPEYALMDDFLRQITPRLA